MQTLKETELQIHLHLTSPIDAQCMPVGRIRGTGDGQSIAQLRKYFRCTSGGLGIPTGSASD